MKNILYIIALLGILSGCSNFKEKIGLVKYQPDEYQVVTNPSLDVPPDFNLYSPSELEAQKKSETVISRGHFSKGEDSILENMNQ